MKQTGQSNLAGALRRRSPLISTAGVLTLFFGWTTVTIEAQRHSTVHVAVLGAETAFRVHRSLREQRDRIDSIHTLVTASNRPAAQEQSVVGLISEARRSFEIVQSESRQLRGLRDFVAEARAFSSSIGNTSEADNKIDSLYEELNRLFLDYIEYERIADVSINGGLASSATGLATAAETFSDYYWNTVNPRLAPIYGEVLIASEKRIEEGRSSIEAANASLRDAEFRAFVLFVAGSVLLLAGKALSPSPGSAKEAV